MIKLIIKHFFLICLLLISGTFYYLTLTVPGMQTNMQIVNYLFPGKLHIGSVQGTLFANFTLQDISWKNDSQDIHIPSITIAWKPSGLLYHKLIINNIIIDHATVSFPQIPAASDSNAGQTNYLAWLKNIEIREAHFNQISVKLADADITLDGTLQKNWNMQWHASIPKINTFFANSTGSFSTLGRITGPFMTPTIQTTLQGKNLSYANQKINQFNAAIHMTMEPKIISSVTVSATGLTLKNYPLKKFDLSVKGNVIRNNKQLTTHLITNINNRYPITLDFVLPELDESKKLNQPVRGKISASLSNMDLLAAYIPQIRQLRGTLQAAVFVDGTLDQPNMTAAINLVNGQFLIPQLGIQLHNINLQGKTSLARQLDFTGSFISGKGHATLTGSVDLNNPDYPLTLQLKGSQLQAVNLSEYNVVITPDVHLTFSKMNLNMQGSIQIPYAEITPQNFSSTVTLPSEVVFVGVKKPAELPFTTTLQLSLELGDNIHIAYQNIQANLGGHLQLSQQPGGLMNAIGELYTKKGASYTAYGQTLKIQTGRLIYTGGSLMNPGLNISAVKKIKSVGTGGNTSSFSSTTSLMPVYTGTQIITVGVEVLGTLQNPVFNLISTPAMAQADVLSYLVFGFPQSQANGNQYGAILSALSSLNPNTQGVGNFTKTIEQKLGLTQLSVESVQIFNPNATSSSSSVVSATSFVVGKKLSDKLSVHYSIGLFYPISILNLRYKLAKHWAIQSETSTLDNGGDILYTIEQD